MERKIYIIFLLLIITIGNLYSQNNKSIYKAYVSNQMDLWKTAMDSIESGGELTDARYLELLNYYYGYTAWCIDQKNYKDAEKYIEKSEDIIEKLEKRNYEMSSLYSYKSALIGYEIALSQYKAPFIGKKSIRYANESVKTDSSNPMGYIQLGNIEYYTPGLFGGSKEEALAYYMRALDLMEKDAIWLRNNWNYLNLLVNIINTYTELEEYDKAKEYCIKALQIEPEFDWVKNNLYPNLHGKR